MNNRERNKSLFLYISDLLDDLLFHKSILIQLQGLCLLLEAPVVREGQGRVQGTSTSWFEILPVLPDGDRSDVCIHFVLKRDLEIGFKSPMDPWLTDRAVVLI